MRPSMLQTQLLLITIPLCLQGANGHSNCLGSTLPPLSELQAPSLPTVALPPPESSSVQQWLFPGLRFGCRGNITAWIFKASNISFAFGSGLPGFEVWYNNSNFFEYDRKHAAATELELLSLENTGDSVFEYRLPEPISVEEGDFLGIRYPVNGNTVLGVLFLEMGPGNANASYRRNEDSNIFSRTRSIFETDNAHVPLVSALIGSPEGVITVPILPTSNTQQPVSTSGSAMQTPSPTPLDQPALRGGRRRVTGGVVGACLGGVFVGAAILLSIVATALCTAREKLGVTNWSLQAIKARFTRGVYYDYPEAPSSYPDAAAAQDDQLRACPYTAIAATDNTKVLESVSVSVENEMYSPNTLPNAAYNSIGLPLQSNEAYDFSKCAEDTATTADEYDYVVHY